MNAQWKLIPNAGNCPSCGDEPEVLTSSTEPDCAWDGEKVRCASCGHPGTTAVDDSMDGGNDADGRLYVNWHDDPKCDCEWCKAHPEGTQ